MRLVFILFSGVALVACTQAETSDKGGPGANSPAAVLAGVDLTQPLRLTGTEPFWGIDLTGSQIVYSGPDRPEEKATQSAPVMQGTMATWATTTNKNRPIEIRLAATECSDGMSDRTYPLTALVKIGDETLNGCAATKAALDTAGESGLVEAPSA